MEGHPLHPVAAAGAVSPALAVRAPSRVALAIVVAGALTTALGLVLAPERTAGGILLAAHYVLGLGLAGLAFLAFGYVLRAGWHTVFRRVPEAFAATLPLGAIATLVSLTCLGLLYPWSHADHVRGDVVLEAKTWWLDPLPFVVRSVVYLAIWLLFARAVLRNSRSQDAEGDLSFTRRNTILSALFLVVFAGTFTLASVDWLMSLEPHWYSTVFAVYDFAGMFTSGLAAILLALVVLRRAGRLPELRDDHLHDLGKLLFAFATFWGYIWFCQHMLIWYANIPEETAWFVERQQGAWSVIHVLNPVVNWMVPFLVLLPRPAKRSASVLVKVSLLVLFGRWLDLFYVIAPNAMPEGPTFGPWEIAPLVALLPVFAWWLRRAFDGAGRIPVGDPYLGESLHHHT